MKELIKTEWHWSLSGVVAGIAVVMAMLIGKNFAIAGAFVALVRNIVNIVNPECLAGTVFIGEVRAADTWMIAMLGGIFLGGFAASRLAGTFQLHGAPAMWSKTFGNSAWKRVITVFTGGILLGVGANIGSGCTTGAFLIGVPTLSVGSFVTSISFFAAAIFAANILYAGKDKKIENLPYQED